MDIWQNFPLGKFGILSPFPCQWQGTVAGLFQTHVFPDHDPPIPGPSNSPVCGRAEQNWSCWLFRTTLASFLPSLS